MNKVIGELEKKCKTILSFFENQSSEKNVTIEAFKKVVDQNLAINNTRGLKILLGDLVEWANGLNASDFKKLNEIYYELYAENINDNNEKMIKRILKKGRIETEEEFRILQLFVEKSEGKNIQKINSILSQYENGSSSV